MKSTHDAVRRSKLVFEHPKLEPPNLNRPKGREAELIAAKQGAADSGTLRLVAQGARTEADHGSWTFGHVTAARLEMLAQWLDTAEAAREQMLQEDALAGLALDLQLAVDREEAVTFSPRGAAALLEALQQQAQTIAGRMADAGLVAVQAQKGLEAAVEYNRQLKGVVNDLLEQVEAAEQRGEKPKLRFAFVAVEGELEPGDLGVEMAQDLAVALGDLNAKSR